MLLRLLGGFSIETDPGEAPVGSLTPRRVALLAVVAAAGARGISRARILGILWPETDEEQARHTLSQTLYLLRKETDRDWITGSTQLRLATGIRSDIGDFQDALDAGDVARAAAHYSGPFLDGFYLAGAPDFEQWVEDTRSRIQHSVLKALETLAKDAEKAHELARALVWWRRLAQLDPFSTTFAAGQLRCLVALGDQPGALRYSREYEARLLRELDARPDPAFLGLVATIRATRSEAAPVATQPVPSVPQQASAVDAPPTTGTAAQPRSRRALLVAASVIVVAGIVALVWNLRGSRAASSQTPFLAIGVISSRDTAAPGPVLRDMLATNLARVAGIRILSNSRLLELLHSGPERASAMADAARRAGASEIIEGELGGGSTSLVLTLRRVALETGLVRQGYTVRALDPYALIDSATAAIARDFHLDPPPGELAAVRTRSGVAYALYEEGLRAYYAGEFASSLRLMNAALARDSSFAMAAFIAWQSAVGLDRYEEMDRLRPIAKGLATRTVDRERLMIEATLSRQDAPLYESLAIAREAVDRYPSDPDGQISLGLALFAAGDWAGSVAAFNRAILIDSVAGAIRGPVCRICNATFGLVQTYLWWDSAVSAERVGRRLVALRSDQAAGWAAMVEPLLRQGRRAAAEAAIANAARLSAGKGDFAASLDRDLIRSGRLDDLETKYLSEVRTAPPDASREIAWLMTIALRNQGRLRAARRLAAEGVLPDGTRLRTDRDETSLAIIAYERGSFHEAASIFLKLADVRAGTTGLGFRSRLRAWNLTLAGTALAADTAAVRVLADSVERIGAESNFGRDYGLPYFLRGLLLQRQNRQAEAVEAFRRALFSVTDGYTRTNLEMARSLMSLGRYREAIAILQPALHGGIDGSNTYVTYTDLHYALAHAFEGVGQEDSARVHFAAVERSWRHADPEFAGRYAEARSKAVAIR